MLGGGVQFECVSPPSLHSAFPSAEMRGGDLVDETNAKRRNVINKNTDAERGE
jgi:hypothetical protein